jgi:4-amino-4-deoxy-L-arabinose transferase-like glycosyltransferase
MTPQSNRVLGDRIQPLTLLVCYTLAVFACLTIRPLWLDEVLQLIVTSSPSIKEMNRLIPFNIGAVPLGYFTQRPFVLAGGPLAFWARLPSALFSVASCWLLISLCRELKISRSTGLLAAGIFMVIPAQFRYATEGRPYSEAIFFMLLAMLAIASSAHSLRYRTILLAFLAMAAALYTQPYAALAVFGLSAWNVLAGFRAKEGLRSAIPFACLCVAALLFLPWYMISTQLWNASIQRSGYPQFHWTFAVALDAFKGLSGGSFLCSLALLVLVAMGIRWSSAGVRGLLLFSALCVLIGVLTTDSLRNYFFASRQFLFAVPSLSILAALGLASALRINKAVGTAAAAFFAITALTNDVSMQLNAKENWPAAAKLLAEVVNQGYCVQMAGADQGGLQMYSVFEPPLLSSLCRDRASTPRLALISNLATTTNTLEASEQQLRSKGFTLTRTLAVGGTTIQMEVR